MVFFWIASSAFVALLIAAIMPFFSSRNQMPVEGKTVLITGASEGLGLAAARQLAAKGANVVIISRNATKLQDALKVITNAAKNPDKQRFHYIAADVGAPDYANAVFAEVTEWNNGAAPDIVWCIAGISMPGLFIETPMWSIRKQMDVNFYGQAEMARTALGVWCAKDAPIEKQAKHFIFTTTLSTFFSLAGYSPYTPSKCAVRGLADALTQELLLYPQKVEVHIVAPGTMITACTEIENKTKPEVVHILEKDDPRFTPDEIAENAIKGLEKGHYMIVKGFLPSFMRFGMLGPIPKNNYVLDTLGAMFTPFVYLFVIPDMLGTLRKYQREHDHPNTYAIQPTKN